MTEPLNHVEGPHWDADQNVLYYTDILGRLVLRFDPATGKRTQVYIGELSYGSARLVSMDFRIVPILESIPMFLH